MDLIERGGAGEPVDQLLLLALTGIADPQPQQEPVELRLRERERPLQLDRVLGGDHQKRARQWTGGAFERDLALLHRLKKGSLGARRGAVQLVYEDNVGEDRPGLEHEPALALIENRHTGHVAREQVRRALETAERAANRPRERPGQGRLTDARHVFDEQVSAGQDGYQCLLDRFRLSDDDIGDASEDRRDLAGERAWSILGNHDPQYNERPICVPPGRVRRLTIRGGITARPWRAARRPEPAPVRRSSR